MTNIGDDWKRSLGEYLARKAEEDALRKIELERYQAQLERQADEASLVEVAALIAEAREKNKPSAKITSVLSLQMNELGKSRHGYLEDSDVAESHRQQGRSAFADDCRCGKGALPAEHFAGRARVIAEWCEKNGLECFVTAHPWSDPNDGDYYELNVRPKS